MTEAEKMARAVERIAENMRRLTDEGRFDSMRPDDREDEESPG